MVKTYIAVKEEQKLLWEIPCLLVGENITQGEEAVLAESIKWNSVFHICTECEKETNHNLTKKLYFWSNLYYQLLHWSVICSLVSRETASVIKPSCNWNGNCRVARHRVVLICIGIFSVWYVSVAWGNMLAAECWCMCNYAFVQLWKCAFVQLLYLCNVHQKSCFRERIFLANAIRLTPIIFILCNFVRSLMTKFCSELFSPIFSWWQSFFALFSLLWCDSWKGATHVVMDTHKHNGIYI